MPQMLRHIPTGDVYHYSDLLLRRGDMEVFETDPPAAAAPEAEPVKRTRKPKEQPVAEQPAPVEAAPVVVQSYASGDNLFDE